MPGSPVPAGQTYQALQERLVPMWPDLTMRATEGPARTLLVISSLTVELPDHMAPVIAAYEERYLCNVLLLAKSPNTRVIYVTSLPILPRLVDYYLTLIPGVVPAQLRDRLTLVSLSDNSFRPLTQKVLERPRVLARLRNLLEGQERRLIVPFVATEFEAQLGLALNTPVYGPDPALAPLGTKTGSRRIFDVAGFPGPAGVEDLRDVEDLINAVQDVQARSGCHDVLIKLDEGVSGLGNAIAHLPADASRSTIRRSLTQLALEDQSGTSERFLATLETSRAVVEELVVGVDMRSPSIQMRASPLGEVEVLSTHDQVLGGPHNQTYLGCRFPAYEEYVRSMVEPGLAIGQELAGRGVIGRFAIDFIATNHPEGWALKPVEINLRNGGTTHPMLTLQALTDASYDCDSGRLDVDGQCKTYLATDHLHHDSFSTLTPDDLLDVIQEAELGWDEQTGTGVVFHMASAIAVAGDVGVTAIGDSHRQSQRLYDAAKTALILAASDSR